MPDRYVRYSPDVEEIADDEAEVADKIIAVMSKGGEVVAKREGKALRTSHAKAHALAAGDLRVLDDLPPELRQGLFAEPRTYKIIARLAHVPGELLDDRRVSTPRGFALKVLDVDGPMLHGEPTQDWVLDTGEVFIARNAKTFLAEITQTEAATPHSLKAHRPLGSIMRARMRVYGIMASRRREANGTPVSEPTSAEPAAARA